MKRIETLLDDIADDATKATLQKTQQSQFTLSKRSIRNPRFKKQIQTSERSWRQVKPSHSNLNAQEIMFIQAKQPKLCRGPVQQYKDDIKYLRDQIRVDIITIDQSVDNYIRESHSSLLKLLQETNTLIISKGNRSKCEVIMKRMNLEVLRQKNVHVQQRLYYVFGKIEALFLNPIQSVIYFKQCKRLSDSEQFAKMKMKAYKGIGEQLMKIRPNLSKLYLTKFLTLAWKTCDQNAELEAYDLLGKYYYYVGKIETAKQFHDRMISGFCEVCYEYQKEQDSRTRTLALRRLQQHTMHNRKHNDHLQVDIDIVSSDEECHEVILTDARTKQTQIEILNSKIKQIHKSIKHVPNQKQIKDSANFNIRHFKQADSIQLGQHFIKHQITTSHLEFGDIKDQVLLSHMTPNRRLDAYQYLGLASNKLSYQNTNSLCGLYDKYESLRVMKQLTGLEKYLKYLCDWLSNEQKMMNNVMSITTRRNGYVIKL